MERLLGVVVIGVGLVGIVAVTVAIAADRWLYTHEPLDTLSYPDNYDDAQATDSTVVLVFTTVSGLWRACIYSTESGVTEADYDELSKAQMSCSWISYLEQSYEPINSTQVSAAVLHSIRRAAPAVVGSLLLMIIGEVVTVIGCVHYDCRLIVGSVMSVLAAICLAVGQVLYILAVSGEVSTWKRPQNAGDDQTLTYRYGWAFYMATCACVLGVTAAVGDVLLYVRRRKVRDDVRRAPVIQPEVPDKMAVHDDDDVSQPSMK